MKILVVDDHALIREGLRLVLRQLDPGVEVLEARNCGEAIAVAEANADADLMILDLHLPGVNGYSALEEMRRRHPELPVVVMSGEERHEAVMGALDRGAMGFIPKSAAPAVMLNALRLVLSGGVYLPPEILARPLAPAPRPAADRPPTPADLGLTERQAEVLALLVQGKPNKVICRELGLAEGTVKIHVTAILKALNVATRTQAVVAVGQLGLKLDSFGRSLPG